MPPTAPENCFKSLIFCPNTVLRSDSECSRTSCTLRFRIGPRLVFEQNLRLVKNFDFLGHRAGGIEQRGFAQQRIQFFKPYALCAMPYAFLHALCL